MNRVPNSTTAVFVLGKDEAMDPLLNPLLGIIADCAIKEVIPTVVFLSEEDTSRFLNGLICAEAGLAIEKMEGVIPVSEFGKVLAAVDRIYHSSLLVHAPNAN